MQSNNFLSVAIDYLFRHRPEWKADAAVGKTVVSSAMIDRVAARLGRKLYEVPVGFKWFVDGLFDGSLGFGGEESAGAPFLRRDGTVWTTDQDGITAALLSAEITARIGRNPGLLYRDITRELGEATGARINAPASPAHKRKLAALSPQQVRIKDMAGEPVKSVLTRAPGNDAAIGGIKVVAENGWFAARPSGTEDVYKIYAESFGEEHCGLSCMRRRSLSMPRWRQKARPEGAVGHRDEAAELAGWLADLGLRNLPLEEMVDGFSRRLNDMGVPVARTFVGMNTLHPMVRMRSPPKAARPVPPRTSSSAMPISTRPSCGEPFA
jgi:hypothetical protein